MTTSKFWHIIEVARQGTDNNRGIIEQNLFEAIAKLEEVDIIGFEIMLRHFILELDDFRILSAYKVYAYIVTDDSFLYFRCWLISQGCIAYYETFKNADYLAVLSSEDYLPDFEGMLYLATRAFSFRTGIEEEDETFPRSIASNFGLDYDSGAPPIKGQGFSDEELPQQFPNLWKKFRD